MPDPKPASSAPSQQIANYLPLPTVQLKPALSVYQAVQQSPGLSALAWRAEQSAQCLRLIAPLIPASMRSGIYAGPLTPTDAANATTSKPTAQWCLLAANSAVAAKLRHMAPSLTAHLRSQGHEVHTLHIKVMV